MSVMYLGLGTNLKDRVANLRLALEQLQEHFTITSVSPVYATEPWGDTKQPAFLNLCVSAKTDHSPRAALGLIKAIEEKMGRRPTRRWGPRLIDIDILFFDDLILDDGDLTIPHPRIPERAFVLAPLADLVPDFRHPQTGRSVIEMLSSVDQSTVKRLPDPLLPEPGADVNHFINSRSPEG